MNFRRSCQRVSHFLYNGRSLRANSSWMQRNCINDANKTKGVQCQLALLFHLSRRRVIIKLYFTTYGNYNLPPRSPIQRCIYMHEQQHGRDSLSRAFMFIYITVSQTHTHTRVVRVHPAQTFTRRKYTNERVSLWNDTETTASDQAGAYVAICRLQA